MADRFEEAGAAILEGKTPPREAPPDQYENAGAAVLAQTPQASTAPPPARWRPYKTGIPQIDDFVEGAGHGAADVVASGANLADWVNKRVPFLAALDRTTGVNPAATANALAEARRAYEASPESQNYFGEGGRLFGQIVSTLPVAGPVAEGVGAGVNALVRLAPNLPAIIPWAVRTATQGGAGGATYGTMTSGGNDQPAADSVSQNALLGAVAGPVASAAAKGAGFVGRGATGAYNYLTGRGAGLEVEKAMAEARARATGGSSEPPPTPSTTPPAPSPPPGVGIPPEPSGAAVPGTAATPGATPTPPPVPTAAGAAPTSAAELAAAAPSRARELAGKVDALDKIISDRPNVGRADFTEYVKGNRPTQAEGLGDARLASIQRQVEPGDQGYTNFRSAAVDNRLEHFERRAGTAEQLDAKETELANWDRKTLEPIWAKKQPVDASGVLADVDERLAGHTAQIGPVEDALNEVRSRLFKRGTDVLHDDPQMLYGARRQISYMLSRAGRQANPAYGNDDVMRELIGVRDQIDKAIEPGAPGFKGWLTGHADASREIDRMDVLQSMRQKLIGANGDIQLSRLTSALKGLRTKMAMDGANPVHSLDIEDIEMLRDLNKDLLRENNKTLSMPVGSPTAHNLDVATEHGLSAVNALAQAGASKIPGAGHVLDSTMSRIGARNAARQKEMWRRNLLDPTPPD